jgi:hypothetical protein
MNLDSFAKLTDVTLGLGKAWLETKEKSLPPKYMIIKYVSG